MSANFYITDNLHSATLNGVRHDLSSMSCNELMLGLIMESSFGNTFSDKSIALEFGFERNAGNSIGLVFVRTNGVDRRGIYVNLRLNLEKSTLMNIDFSPPIPIKINKDYIAYITDKCTPEKNIYLHTGKLPD